MFTSGRNRRLLLFRRVRPTPSRTRPCLQKILEPAPNLRDERRRRSPPRPRSRPRPLLLLLCGALDGDETVGAGTSKKISAAPGHSQAF